MQCWCTYFDSLVKTGATVRVCVRVYLLATALLGRNWSGFTLAPEDLSLSQPAKMGIKYHIYMLVRSGVPILTLTGLESHLGGKLLRI